MAISSFYRRFPLQNQSVAGYYSDRMLQLSGQPLSLREIARIADASVRVQIPDAAVAQMEASRTVVRGAAAVGPAPPLVPPRPQRPPPRLRHQCGFWQPLRSPLP